MTSEIIILGAHAGVVNPRGGTDVYALASGRAGRILRRVTPLGKVTSHLACLLT